MRKRREIDLLEEWRVIPGYPDYEISEYGRVRSYKDRYAFEHKRVEEPNILTQQINKDGYRFVRLMGDDGKSHKLYINNTVGRAFIPNPDNKPEVNHKDGNKANNHVSNLEWATHAENMRHAIQTGLWDAERSRAAALEAWRRKVYCYETDSVFNSVADAADFCGVCRANVVNCCKGDVYHCNGYHLAYAEDAEYLIRNIDSIKAKQGMKRRVKAINVHTGEERIYLSRQEASRELGISDSYISNIIAGRSYQTRGWTFEDLPVILEER